MGGGVCDSVLCGNDPNELTELLFFILLCSSPYSRELFFTNLDVTVMATVFWDFYLGAGGGSKISSCKCSRIAVGQTATSKNMVKVNSRKMFSDRARNLSHCGFLL